MVSEVIFIQPFIYSDLPTPATSYRELRIYIIKSIIKITKGVLINILKMIDISTEDSSLIRYIWSCDVHAFNFYSILFFLPLFTYLVSQITCVFIRHILLRLVYFNTHGLITRKCGITVPT